MEPSTARRRSRSAIESVRVFTVIPSVRDWATFPVWTPPMLPRLAPRAGPPLIAATRVSPERIESATWLMVPARRRVNRSTIAGLSQNRSLRIIRTSSRLWSMPLIVKGPPDAGNPLSMPDWKPPGAPLRTCDGRRSLNSSRHAGYGAAKVAVTSLPPPPLRTSVISRYPAGAVTLGCRDICCQR